MKLVQDYKARANVTMSLCTETIIQHFSSNSSIASSNHQLLFCFHYFTFKDISFRNIRDVLRDLVAKA